MKQELKDLPTILKSLVNSSSIQKVILDCCVQREAEEDVGTEKMQEQDKCMQEYAKEITSALLCLPCEKLEIRVILTSHPFWDLLNGVYCNVAGWHQILFILRISVNERSAVNYHTGNSGRHERLYEYKRYSGRLRE